MPMRPKKNPITKIVVAGVKAAAKAAGKNVKPSLKAAQKAKPLANPKSAVKVKGAAKPKPNKPDAAKTTFKNDSSRNRAANTAYKKVEAATRKYKVEERTGYEHRYASDAAERAGNQAKLKRKPNLPSTPIAKKAAKIEKKLYKKYKNDMTNPE